ncbi:MAG TPA: bifunctional 5,10-methylenetetrahydrofolate dehydrogenase/5,10-methenyltetrahydrofolate cyclohydrolase [Candidatus Saccharibacteria bacterium]|nr:bifunctional 5,10-methylenetetrahydrofolate dehydrogenase/5,10-methenyltetrahydrofolate cyclohydrolase [Candidatus Saccharibacteria bacterium]
MKLLNGSELSGYIKERQAKQVRSLRQSWRVFPRLAILYTSNNPTIETYMRLKHEYGADIGVIVDIYNPSESELLEQINKLNNDDSVHGIIIQLPLNNPNQVEEAVNAVNGEKDVDGLGINARFSPATAMAINWLLVGYNINLDEKRIAIVGNGRLVGSPLAKMWRDSKFDVSVFDSKTKNLSEVLSSADIIVSATGVPGLIKNEMIKGGAVVVDAGTASEHGKIVGDLAEDVRERDDLSITPQKGGVGPLTVSALFDNVILSARRVADKKGQQDI